MPSRESHRDWIEIGSTLLPAPPRGSRICVSALDGDRFDVTFPSSATVVRLFLDAILLVATALGLLLIRIVFQPALKQPHIVGISLACLAILVFIDKRFFVHLYTRPEGGRLQLRRRELTWQRGVMWRVGGRKPVDSTAKFSVDDIGGTDSISWVLQFLSRKQATVVARETDLTRPEMNWLCRQMNAWLGWEFPTHCVSCGAGLDSRDVDWPRRCVSCTACGFLGPDPDPFPVDAVPEAPPSQCPSCQTGFPLWRVNRDTGGCRCPHCSWSTTAAPPSHSPDRVPLWEAMVGVCERAIATGMQHQAWFFPEPYVRQWFAGEPQARFALQSANWLRDEFSPEPVVEYSRWQIDRLGWAVGGLLAQTAGAVALFVGTGQVPGGQRSWLGFGLHCSAGLTVLATGGACWWLTAWAMGRERLTFKRDALHWRTGKHELWLSWGTLEQVLVARPRPAMVFFRQGTAGLMLGAPDTETALAIARLCLERQSGKSATTATREVPEDEPQGIAGSRLALPAVDKAQPQE